MKALSKWLMFALIMILIQLLLSENSFAAGDVLNRKVISVIDTGIDLKNEKLKPFLCQNSGEMGLDKKSATKDGNEKDDDGNGFADDLHGWSFYDNSNDIQDNHGHGTHIVSIILSGLKDLGLQNSYCFQILKYYDSEDFSSDLLKGSNNSFRYALDNGATMVNYSGGGYSFNRDEFRLIQALAAKNVPVIAAMGNQKVNTDLIPFYPASYDSENIFAVAAADAKQIRAAFSNYGKKRFDFLAPGVSVKGFGLNGSAVFLSGTSQATAKTTAVVAYMLAQESEVVSWRTLKNTVKNWRQVFLSKNQTGNPLFVDSTFISKHKSALVNAFGESASQ